MAHRKTYNKDWELQKRPKAPKQIRAKGIRGMLGVISPSKAYASAAAGDKQAQKYFDDVRKYLNYKRMTTKEEWRTFYRYTRWKKRCERSERKCMEI